MPVDSGRVPHPYARPELVKLDNLRDITFECPDWQCSVTVPGAPGA